jgi:hypothetical protein
MESLYKGIEIGDKLLKMKANLNCYQTHWEYNGETHGCSIFAKTLEEAEEMLKQKKQTERISGQIIAEYCLNSSEFEVTIIDQIPKS